MAQLPKLEKLTITDEAGCFTGQIFKHFTTLKIVEITYMQNMKEGIRDLLWKCKDIMGIKISRYPKDDIIFIFELVENIMRVRNIIDFPFIIRLNGCSVRMLTKKSKVDSSVNISYEIYLHVRGNKYFEDYTKHIDNSALLFTSDDKGIFDIVISQAINTLSALASYHFF